MNKQKIKKKKLSITILLYDKRKEEEGRRFKSEVEPEKRGVGESGFRFCSNFSLSDSVTNCQQINFLKLSLSCQ